MILLVTNRQDHTADFLVVELRKRKVDFFRFNTEDFPVKSVIRWELDNRQICGEFQFSNRKITFGEIKSVWYRRPVMPVIDDKITNATERIFAMDESKKLVDGIWRTLNCFWVSHPESINRAENKLYQLQIANSIGFLIWPTLITNSPQKVKEFFDHHKDIIYKPLKSGKINSKNGTNLIFTTLLEEKHIKFFGDISYAPGIFQKQIKKDIELRVTVIGDKVFAVEIHSQEFVDTLIDWRCLDSDKLEHKFHHLPIDIENMCKKIVKQLDLQFGAIDLVLTPKGEYIFLEINPNGQWAWIQRILPEVPLRETLADLLINGESK
jgi:hypothetical protein